MKNSLTIEINDKSMAAMVYLLANVAPCCLHCGKLKGSTCPVGYPGCGLVDDMALASPELDELLKFWDEAKVVQKDSENENEGEINVF